MERTLSNCCRQSVTTAQMPSKCRARRHGRHVVTPLVLTMCVVLLELLAGPASARDYNGTDPYKTGCATSGHTIAGKSVAGGTLALMWSTVCKTYWATYTSKGAGRIAVWVIVGEKSCGDQRSSGCGSHWWHDSAYSNQLATTCSGTASAKVEIYNSGHPYYADTNAVGGC